MTRPQSIVVSGEASESDEEEEFCATTSSKSNLSDKNYLLHQKLWNVNGSLEQRLKFQAQEPITNCTIKVSNLSSALPSVHNKTISTHSALAQAGHNLQDINKILGIIDPLPCLKFGRGGQTGRKD